jgi:hypothetical protein
MSECLSVMFISYLFLFGWSSTMAILRRSCSKQYRYMGSLDLKTYFKAFYASLLEMNVAIHKLVSIKTDGAPSMTNENVSLIGLCKKNLAFRDVFSYQCVIHQQALCT